jgi:hypothetical protein
MAPTPAPMAAPVMCFSPDSAVAGTSTSAPNMTPARMCLCIVVSNVDLPKFPESVDPLRPPAKQLQLRLRVSARGQLKPDYVNERPSTQLAHAAVSPLVAGELRIPVGFHFACGGRFTAIPALHSTLQGLRVPGFSSQATRGFLRLAI